MIIWESGEAESATGGRSTQGWQASGVSIDSRSLQPGDLFVALSDKRDGHDFVEHAFNAGAAAALVSRIPDGLSDLGPYLVVSEVLEALERMGRFRRAECRAKVIAVTGSAGKTSTKEMLKSVLEKQGPTHSSAFSYNNQWGVPLTLARLPQQSQYAVIEIGMNGPGEISTLGEMVRPHVGIVTTIARAHLAGFDSLEDIASEKAQIFQWIEPGGTAILNSDLTTSHILRCYAERAGAAIVSFGRTDAADYRLLQTRSAMTGTVFKVASPGNVQLARISAHGEHFAVNALAVLAAVEAVQGDADLAAIDLSEWRPPSGRGRCYEVVLDRFDKGKAFMLLDDAFNCNPASLVAGLRALNSLNARHDRVAVLSDMLELGPRDAEIHAELASHPDMKRISRIHCIGPLMRHLYQALPTDQRGIWHESAEEMVAEAHRLASSGDVVLVKGSKGSRASLVAKALRSLNQSSHIV